MTVSFLALSVTRAREGGVTISLRYSYDVGKPPSLKKRAEMAEAVLREALDRLECGRPVDLGFGEDATKRVRTDKMEA